MRANFLLYPSVFHLRARYEARGPLTWGVPGFRSRNRSAKSSANGQREDSNREKVAQDEPRERYTANPDCSPQPAAKPSRAIDRSSETPYYPGFKLLWGAN
jgi:hypothetical protein